jgi:hypothetical protein
MHDGARIHLGIFQLKITLTNSKVWHTSFPASKVFSFFFARRVHICTSVIIVVRDMFSFVLASLSRCLH